MFPHERSLVEQYAGKPFAIVGVNSDKDLDEVKPKFTDEKITWRSFWCGSEGTQGPIPTRWNVRGWPTLVAIDHDGIIRKRWLGGPDTEEEKQAFDKVLADLVAKAPASGQQAGKKGD